MENQDPARPPATSPLSRTELEAVDKFRQSRKTSVLTILFTDIEGFTRLTEEKGDEVSDKLRKLHDETIVPAIEEGGAGQVIKHIGDSIMAVFAEPSSAVARALEVQRRMRRLAEKDPALPELKVRIGMHMGQVTVEDQVSPDVFGRHVNRASRVEGLAAGGQVLLTYGVFDSAKSWLLSQPRGEAAWVLHGRYRVKGIEEPLEIYEVYDPRIAKPRPPDGARKVSSLPRLAPALALLAAGALAALGLLRLHRTTVAFEDLDVRTDLLLDHGTRLTVEGEPGAHLRKCLTPIPKGRHLLYYDVSYVTRYYSPFEVKRGENLVRPKFEYAPMPGIDRMFSWEKGSPGPWSESQEATYATYGSSLERLDHPAKMTISAKAQVDKPDKPIRWDLSWELTLDGKKISETQQATHDPAAGEDTRWEKTVFKDDRHYWNFRYRLSGRSAELEIQSAYIEYLR